MSRFGITVSIGLVSLLISSSALAGDADGMLNAPGWDLAYEVTFKANDSGPSTSMHGPTSYTMSIECVYSATLALDMRIGGPSLSMLRLASTLDPTSSDMQEKSMELVMRSDVMANWMSVAPLDENASDDELRNAMLTYMESSKGRGRIEYKRVVTGSNLVTEMGTIYNMTSTTTRKGNGPIHGPTQLTFELDAESKTYMLTLALKFGDNSDSSVVEDVLTVSQARGEPPLEERTRSYSGLDDFPTGLTIDDSTAATGAVPLFEGTFDPSLGKITGERTVRGHCSERGSDVDGTFLFRWTLTPRE